MSDQHIDPPAVKRSNRDSTDWWWELHAGCGVIPGLVERIRQLERQVEAAKQPPAAEYVSEADETGFRSQLTQAMGRGLNQGAPARD